MSKAITAAKVSARGGLHLFLGVALSSVISAAGVVILARLLTPTQYGLYTIALLPPAMIGLFRDWGMNFAMIKYLSQYKSENKAAHVKRVLASGLLFELILGALLSIVCFFLASFMASTVFHRQELQSLIGIASITILSSALLTAAQSAFTGFERMELNSLTMIIQSTLKSFIVPLFVLLGYGTLGAVYGYTAALIVSGLAGILILYIILRKNFLEGINGSNNIKTTLKAMLKYGLPLAVSTILGGFLGQFYIIMLAVYCSDLIIGNYQAAINFTVVITFFTTPITTVLFPAFSKLNSKTEMETLRKIFQSSIKYASLLTMPATMAIMVLSTPLVFIFFGEKYTFAPLFLTLYAISYLYTALGNLSLENFINGQGETMVTMRLTLVGLATGIPLSLFLIPVFEVTGLVTTILISGFVSLAVGLWWIRKHYRLTVDWASSTRMLAASATAAIVTLLALSQLHTSQWITLIVGGTIFFFTYLIATPLTKALTANDINELRLMFGELGVFSYIFGLPLNLMEKVIVYRGGQATKRRNGNNRQQQSAR